jgi:hypothetical protein
MIGLYFSVGALVLLVTVLLFGFVGCSFHGGVASPGQDYPTTVRGTTDLVAYWRLGEPDTTPVPSSGGAAKDGSMGEGVGNFPGDYFKLDPVATPDDLRHSPAHPGAIILGDTPGLLELTPQDEFACIFTDGGYVQVPWHEELNPSQFTFEAWVSPNLTLDPKYFYCLVESTGPQGLGPKKTGWGLYLGPSDLANPDPAGPLFWQVWMGDGNQLNRVAIAKPDFPKPGFSQLRLTYLALTFNGVENLQLFLYFPDTGQNLSLEQLQALGTPSSPIIFHRNDPSPDGQGDFFIGTGSNLTLNPASQRLYPFKGKIQEVALYKSDLSAPNNAGVQSTLAGHEMSGGNL